MENINGFCLSNKTIIILEKINSIEPYINRHGTIVEYRVTLDNESSYKITLEDYNKLIAIIN